ncbi:MAG: hypothetical protein F6K25_08925 [Okeania sp. SIO2G4]|uniref:hypothetical protein n=1 Tax=unclassified Okeania TaxID=2634635 RepID=UPI0013B82BC5|nr:MULTISPECIES: hypothetical protein [unclassified Okeania]NEP72214.1 hypothetical protein [Okeania sp. SIO2G5]NEP94669.1 hypothetical protein [Okeania sp. SIO2F5]NEQ90828.1 hypothetical protein [Okeania sp. SIO2G4]
MKNIKLFSMLPKVFEQLGKLFNKSYIKLGAILALITLIGLSTVNHHGISVDEHLYLKIVQWNWEFIQEGKTIPSDLKFYGIVFDKVAEIIFQVKHWLETHLFSRPPLEPYLSAVDSEILVLDRFLTKHVFTFCVSLISYLSVAGGITLLYGKKWAWLAPLMLALFPRFWGHSFFNPRDIPFAALFSLCIYLGAYIVEEIKQNSNSPFFLGIQRTSIRAIGYGILVGLLSGIRTGGFMMLGFVGLVSLILIPRNNIGKFLKFYLVNYVLMTVSWAIALFCVTPSSWSNPFRWFWDAISYFSQHEWPGSVLFKGEFIKGSELPWDYLPTWFLITTPSIFLFYFLLGLIGLTRKYHQFSDRQKAYILLVILQIFLLPMIAIIKSSTIYDGLRHFLFVIPGMAIVTTIGFIWSYQQISQPRFKRWLVGVTLLGVLIILFDMVTIHPYEYIYFNRVFGGLQAAHRQYETDYWALSMRNGIEWINQNGKKGAIIAVPRWWSLYSAKPFATSDFTVIDQNELKKMKLEQPDYYLYFYRFKYEENFPSCDPVYSVTRKGVPLTTVKDCTANTDESY